MHSPKLPYPFDPVSRPESYKADHHLQKIYKYQFKYIPQYIQQTHSSDRDKQKKGMIIISQPPQWKADDSTHERAHLGTT